MKKFKKFGFLISALLITGTMICLNSQDSKEDLSRKQVIVSTSEPQMVRMEHINPSTKCKTYDEVNAELLSASVLSSITSPENQSSLGLLQVKDKQIEAELYKPTPAGAQSTQSDSFTTYEQPPTELTPPAYEEPVQDEGISPTESTPPAYEEPVADEPEVIEPEVDSAYESITNEVSESQIALKPIPDTIEELDDKYRYYAEMFDVDPEILKAMCSQECGGDLGCTGAAKGVAQIEDSVVGNFIKFGRDVFGQEWSESDRYNTNCAIAFLAYMLNTYLQHYDGDYCKAIQAYNYSHYSLDKLINEYGDNWMDYRDEMAYLNGHYARTGRSSYGDSQYIEHVLRYYHPE